MMCGEHCESDDWLLGVAGNCTETEVDGDSEQVEACVCPPGYWGKDDWATYDDCHVNVKVQETMWTIIFVLCFLGVVVSLGALGYLLRRWQNLLWHSKATQAIRRLSRAPSELSTSGLSTSPVKRKPKKVGGTSRKTKKEKAETRKRKYVILSILLLLTFHVSCLVYISPMYFSQITRTGELWYQDFAAAVGVSAILVALWVLFFTWYLSLPSLRHYGTLLGIDSFFIRNPAVVQYNIKARIFGIPVVTTTLFFLINAVNQNPPEDRYFLDTLAVWWMGICAFDFFVFTVLLMVLFDRLFAKFEQSTLDMEKSGVMVQGSTMVSAFEKTRYTLFYLKILVTGLLLPACLIFMLINTVPPMRSALYLIQNINLTIANLGGLSLVIFYIARMAGTSDRPASTSSADSQSHTPVVYNGENFLDDSKNNGVDRFL